MIKNEEVITTGSEILIYSDKYFDKYEKIKFPYAFEKNDTVTVEFHKISKEMFEYYYELTDQFFYYNYSNIGYKKNLPTMFNNGAMGYFHVSSVMSKTMIIR